MPLLLLLYLLIISMTSFLCAYLAFYAWQRPSIVGSQLLGLCLAAITEITLCFVALSFTTHAEIAFFWARLRFLGLAFAGYFFWLFVVEYTTWQIPRLLLKLLGIIPILTQIVVWLAPQYFFLDWRLVNLGIMRIDVNGFQGWFNVHNIFSQFFLISAFFRLLYYVFRVESNKRTAAWWIIFGTLVALVLSMPFLNRPEWLLPKLTPLGMGIMGLFLAFALFRLDFFQALPIAYDVIFQHIRAAAFIINSNKKLMQLNPFAVNLLQTTESQLLQLPIAEIFQRYFGQDFPNAAEDVWEFQQEKDGQIFYYEATIVQLKRGKQLLGYLVTVRDMSIYKEAETNALALSLEQERLRLLSEFVQHTSHDLRNPLATINAAVYVLQKTDDKERRHKALERISDQSHRIDQLLSQFHSFMRLENQNINSASPLDVQEILAQLQDKYRPLLEKQQLAFHFASPAQPLPLLGDADFLRQALDALLDNAMLYNKTGGEIWLEATVETTTLLLTVRDTGQGIAPEKLARIYDSFYKGNEARTNDGSGAGIGLALVQRVAKLYQGTIQIESSLNAGTTAQLSLPLSSQN